MLIEKLELRSEAAAHEEIVNTKDQAGAPCGYQAPELQIVGKAGQLVQGRFGNTDSDGTYYYS